MRVRVRVRVRVNCLILRYGEGDRRSLLIGNAQIYLAIHFLSCTFVGEKAKIWNRHY